MDITLSVLKADIGSIGGHVQPSGAIVETVRDNGGEVWYLLAMNEGHGFARKSNRDYFQAATVMFFRQLFEPAAN